MTNKKVMIAMASILILGFFYWFYFVDTLKLSEITGRPNNPVSSFFVNLIDFNTGLTRYDVYNLSRKHDYWQRRIQEVMSIQNPEMRKIENEKLLAEMMEDPSIKKIANRLMGFGTEVALSILQASSR